MNKRLKHVKYNYSVLIKKVIQLLVIGYLSLLFIGCQDSQTEKSNWTHYARISGNPLSSNNVQQIINQAQKSHVLGIEVDNDITGRYGSFLDPKKKLKVIKSAVKEVHKAGNYIFVYIAGLECITENSNDKRHTFFKDHPDWVQRDIEGNPAVFGSEDAFWIDEGDEDVWISPYAEPWREIYMQRIRQIAKTGIDGIYVDIPYWMTHFKGWENSWASFDKYTVTNFMKQTGLNAKTELDLGNFRDPNFRKWIDFRIKAISDFMKEIDANIKSINPDCKTIAEIYPGIGEEAVRVGADVYELYDVVDVICHEYSTGGYTAAERTPFDWIKYMAAMYTFRALAGKKASWMLSYSWDKNEEVNKQEAMHNMFVSHIMAGMNTWDAKGHIMSQSNDITTRLKVYNWIKNNEEKIYSTRSSINPIGVYFSPKTRNYFPYELSKEYLGIMSILLQTHQEFEIITPRTLHNFTGHILILPGVKIINSTEIDLLNSYYKRGGFLVMTGETNINKKFDDVTFFDKKIYKDTLINKMPIQYGDHYMYYPSNIGAEFLAKEKNDFNKYVKTGTYKGTDFNKINKDFIHQIYSFCNYEPQIEIKGSPYITANITEVKGKPYIFFTNFMGVIANKNANQIPVDSIKLIIHNQSYNLVHMQEYMKATKEIETSQNGNILSCKLPEFHKGAIVWVE